MLFAFSIGSSGNAPERYTLYLPFEVARGRDISLTDPPSQVEVAGVVMCVHRNQNYLALMAGGFESEDDARAFREPVSAAMLWATLQSRMGIYLSKKTQEVDLRECPISVAEGSAFIDVVGPKGWSEVDGFYDADSGAIIPEHKRLIRTEMGGASVTLGCSNAKFLDSIVEALGFANLDSVLADEKLRLAIELYSSSFFEFSKRARFVVLVSTLEALTPDKEVSAASAIVVKALRDVVKERRDEHKRDDPEWGALERLLSRVGSLKRDSIGASMRHFFAGVASDSGELGKPDEVEDALKRVYDTRSTLLHEGAVAAKRIEEGLEFLQGFVPGALTCCFRGTAGAARPT